MMPEQANVLHRLPSASCHPMVAWVVESDGIAVIRTDSGRSAFLRYPEAALWDFVSRGVPDSRLLPMLSALMKCPAGAVADWVRERLVDWVEAGWLRDGGPRG